MSQDLVNFLRVARLHDVKAPMTVGQLSLLSGRKESNIRSNFHRAGIKGVRLTVNGEPSVGELRFTNEDYTAALPELGFRENSRESTILALFSRIFEYEPPPKVSLDPPPEESPRKTQESSAFDVGTERALYSTYISRRSDPTISATEVATLPPTSDLSYSQNKKDQILGTKKARASAFPQQSKLRRNGARLVYPEQYVRFAAAYPEALDRSRVSMSRSYPAWRKIAVDEGHEEMEVAARNYASTFIAHGGTQDLKFVRGMSSWLSKGDWRCYLDGSHEVEEVPSIQDAGDVWDG